MKKWFLALMSAMLLLTACGGNDTKTEVSIDKVESAGLSYELVAAERGDVTSSVLVTLSYGASETEDYSFSVKNGKIEFVYVERGDYVEKGDVLATLESEGLESRIDSYEFQLQTAELELKQLIERRDFEIETEDYLYSYTHKTEEDRKTADENIEKIKERYAMSITTYEDNISILKLRLDEAKKDYEESRIVSKVNGVVSFCKTNLEGSTVKPGDVIIKVSDETKCGFSSVESNKAEYFTEGKEYTVLVGAGASAREYMVVPKNMSEWNKTLYFDTIGDTNTLSINESGRITIILEEAKDVVTLPVAALHKSEGKYFVYYLDENAVRRRKWVTTGLEGKDYVEIVDGVSEGEYVILK